MYSHANLKGRVAAREATADLPANPESGGPTLALTPPARKKNRSASVRNTAEVAMESLNVQSHSRNVCMYLWKGWGTGAQVGLHGAAQHAQGLAGGSTACAAH